MLRPPGLNRRAQPVQHLHPLRQLALRAAAPRGASSRHGHAHVRALLEACSSNCAQFERRLDEGQNDTLESFPSGSLEVSSWKVCDICDVNTGVGEGWGGGAGGNHSRSTIISDIMLGSTAGRRAHMSSPHILVD
jgi:hypothetical protein